jgi:phospholipid transport system substrate-binding protein
LRRGFAVALLLACAAAVLSSSPAHSADGAPLKVVRESNESVLGIYRTVEKIDAAAEEKILAIIDSVTDYESLAGKATDRSCRDLSEEECREFRKVFIELLRISAVKKLGRYRADRFSYLGEELSGDEAVVETVAYFGEDEVSLEYHLDRSGGEWRIVNYVVDDIDTIRNYKKQFNRLFAKKSLEEVLQRLRDRIAQYRQEGSS